MKGLAYIPNFVTPDEESELLAAIDREPWRTDLKRRVQHYGYRYDYTSRSVDASMYLGELPAWVQFLRERLVEKGVMPIIPDQLIVNEYVPGQGIAAHVDCIPCFSATICSISLGSRCIMDFCSIHEGDKEHLLLERCSLLAISSDARYDWTHGIAARKSDKIEGEAVPRDRRVSLTFRNVRLEKKA